MTFIRITSDTTNLRPGTVWRVIETLGAVLRVTDPTGMTTAHIFATDAVEISRKVFLHESSPWLREWSEEAKEA